MLYREIIAVCSEIRKNAKKNIVLSERRIS
jgi:hypothetical protein